MDQLDRIRLVEKELQRINKVIRNPDYNPVDVFDLSIPFTHRDVKMKYFTIIRLIHPDKNWNLDRFCQAFDIVNSCYQILLDDQKKNVCVKCKKKFTTSNISLLKKISQSDHLKDGEIFGAECQSEQSNERRLVKWVPGVLSIIHNNLSQQQVNVSVNIAIDGAEHTKNKCKSKSDKHDKGLKQRVIQRKNAEKRIKNHHFSFTDKVTLEVMSEQ